MLPRVVSHAHGLTLNSALQNVIFAGRCTEADVERAARDRRLEVGGDGGKVGGRGIVGEVVRNALRAVGATMSVRSLGPVVLPQIVRGARVSRNSSQRTGSAFAERDRAAADAIGQRVLEPARVLDGVERGRPLRQRSCPLPVIHV